MNRFSILMILLLAACSKDAQTVDPVDYLTAHVWKSVNYVINNRQYNTLTQYRSYIKNDTLPGLHLYPGDSMKYVFNYELLFTNDYILKEARYLDLYYKCNSCNTFLPLENYIFSSEEVYTVNNTYLFITAENVVLLDSASDNTHRYKLIDNKKMELYDWRIVRNTNPDRYNVSVNGISVQPGEDVPVDFVFEASL